MNFKNNCFRVSALTLSAAMVFSAASCSSVSKGSVNKNPGEEVENALSESVNLVVDKDSPAAIANGLKSSGKIHYIVSKDEYSYEVWSNSNAEAAVKIDFDGETVQAYLSNSGIAVKSETLFGEEKAYGIDFKKAGKNLPKSEIWDMLDIDYEDFYDEYGDEIDAVTDFLGNIGKYVNDGKKAVLSAKKEAYKALKEADHSTKDDTVKVNDGEVKAVVLEYDLEKDIIDDVVDAFADGIEEAKLYDFVDELMPHSNIIDGIFSELKYSASELDGCELTVAISKSNGALVFAELNTEYANYTLDLGVNPAKSEEFVLSCEYKNGDLSEIVYERSSSKDSLERVLTFKEDGTEAESFEFELNKKDGSFALKNYFRDTVVSEITGTLKYSDKSFELFVGEIDGEEIGLTVKADTSTNVPKLPKFTDALKMSEEDIEALGETVQENLEKLTAGALYMSSAASSFAMSY